MGNKRWNDSACARFLIRKLHSLITGTAARHLFEHSGPVLFLSSKICVKSSSFTNLAEAHAMEFIRQHTSVPVPKVHMAFEHKGRVYIVMERIDGTYLGKGWVWRSEASKTTILNQLRNMVEEWRSIPPPVDVGVANVDGGPVYDARLPGKHLWGPYSSCRQFHKELCNGLGPEHLGTEHLTGHSFPGLHELASYHEQDPFTPVFTHGDLSSLNILCRDDEVVGIIDWETAGWWPDYWEYVTTWNVNPQNTFWQDEVDKFLTPWPHALKMEAIRRRYFGDF